MLMSNLLYHKEITDSQWNQIKFLFEEPKKVGRPSLNPRTVLNGILWILKSGARWRDLPERYGNWNSVNTKIHVLLNERMQLLNVVLTGGQIHDSATVFELFAGIEFEGKKVLAERAYSCDNVRSYLEQRGATVCIPDKVNFKVKHTFDAELYKQRNLVERFFSAD